MKKAQKGALQNLKFELQRLSTCDNSDEKPGEYEPHEDGYCREDAVSRTLEVTEPPEMLALWCWLGGGSDAARAPGSQPHAPLRYSPQPAEH